MGISQLPTSADSRVIDSLNKAKEITNGRLGFSVYGPTLASCLPNGVFLNFSIEPDIYYGSEIENPETVESFTVRFAAYTEKPTPEGLMAVFLTNEEVEALLNPADSKTRQVCDVVKEMNGLELTISRKELLEIERLSCEDERQYFEEACRLAEAQEENSVSGPSLCVY